MRSPGWKETSPTITARAKGWPERVGGWEIEARISSTSSTPDNFTVQVPFAASITNLARPFNLDQSVSCRGLPNKPFTISGNWKSSNLLDTLASSTLGPRWKAPRLRRGRAAFSGAPCACCVCGSSGQAVGCAIEGSAGALVLLS